MLQIYYRPSKKLIWNFLKPRAYNGKRHTQKGKQMDAQLKQVLEKSPPLDWGDSYHLRYDSLKNYIEDLEHQLYWFKEERMVEEAKDGYELVKRSNVKQSTLDSYKKEYKDVQLEYGQLKKHLKYINKQRS
jgi:hypothetical protein